jgi:N-acetylglucosaminyldiphosphoundecaprenol N-acetyl-beta-D-mannosaminyltransferase
VTSGTRQRLQLGQLTVDRIDMNGALDAIASLVARQRGGTIFTPNVDHVVLASEDQEFRRAYAAADLSLADGMPVVWASHLLGAPVPEKISGSDLVEPLIELAAKKGWRVYLLGGGEGVAQGAASALQRRHAQLKIVGTGSPRIDLTEPVSRRTHVLDAIRSCAPDIVLVGFGAPKQELWMYESSAALRPAVLLGIGASLDFLAGTAKRAPKWMSRSGLEWLYRLAREPRRMWRRYLVRDPKFLAILARDLLKRRTAARSARVLPP